MPAELTKRSLAQIMPGCANPAEWVPPLNEAMARFRQTALALPSRRARHSYGSIAIDTNHIRTVL